MGALRRRIAQMARVIGVDFDNTVAIYDESACTVAAELGLVPWQVGRSIKAVRDEIRRLPDGDDRWQEVQAAIYGPRIGEARIAPGAGDFFRKCREREEAVVLISHKARYATKDAHRIDLRLSALAWMREHNFFTAPGGLGLDESAVFFESTREEKVKRIGMTGCTHFIDDLPEVFSHEQFPDGIEKLQYAPLGSTVVPDDARSFQSWREITDYLFPD